ncbi:FHA domain-containing protein [Paenibacillus albus]|uniref:FHA domain-containing protein n=1 Tax=Paenibacillus albus TaxID=2495582 RepID=A0A3Q8X427_9BACL|nr:FHA domain-containing protein [Paenibacillus albus]AZN39945.1 FHA domain-containing protein [Paenibacillus albus]
MTMSYQIQSKSDLSTGASLIVRIPESELDKKALYTIMADTPDFVLPFHFKNVDGEVEFTYIIGARNKLQYAYGTRNSKEYAALWSSVLSPLLECSDWFMNPTSFVLNTDYLYYDKASGTISYVYIPSIRECSDNDTLNQMATELAQKCPTDNSELEIKALRAIMQGFNPKRFLQMLKTYQKPQLSENAASLDRNVQSHEDRLPKESVPFNPQLQPQPQPQPQQEPQPISGSADDIVINLNGAKDKEKKRGSGLFGGITGKKQAAEQASEPPKMKGSGLFGKKKAAPQPMFMGAAADQQPTPAQRHQAAPPVIQHFDDVGDEMTQLEGDGLTQLAEANVKFRFVGHASLPPEIIISGSIDSPFVIGRFDISVGRKQADFEFDKSTKSISRRHAAVERSAIGYSIVDLSSSAGTFVNGQRLTPNVPHELTFGSRVSFGTSGADYVFER